MKFLCILVLCVIFVWVMIYFLMRFWIVCYLILLLLNWRCVVMSFRMVNIDFKVLMMRKRCGNLLFRFVWNVYSVVKFFGNNIRNIIFIIDWYGILRGRYYRRLVKKMVMRIKIIIISLLLSFMFLSIYGLLRLFIII